MAESGRVHIIGAGLAGLACAVALTKKNVPVSIYEASGMAGGRCRSWMDAKLGCTIDNGNHLILSANRNVLKYADLIGSRAQLAPAKSEGYTFVNRTNLQTFTIRHGRPLPVSLREQLGLLKLAFAGSARVGEMFDNDSRIYKDFIDPLTISALNTPTKIASAKLLRKVLADWLFKSDARTNYYIPSPSLDTALVAPALAFINAAGHNVAYHAAVKSLVHENGRIAKIAFQDNEITLEAQDRVVLAVPPQLLEKIIPELALNLTYHPIVNVHFLMKGRSDYLALSQARDMLGVVESPLHWIFFKPDILSTTSSAADTLAGESQDEISRIIWDEVCEVLQLTSVAMPPARVIVEARATFACTPENDAKRPGTRTVFPNCFLAGDYIKTGMPGAIESAVLSGFMAATAADHL